MTSTETPRPRPALRFESIADVLTDVESLDGESVRATGTWTPAQIVEHLAGAIDCSIDGYHLRAPALARMKARSMKDRVLRDGLPTGIGLKGKLRDMLPPENVTWDAAVAHFRDAVARAGREPMDADHPFLGVLTNDEWHQLHCRHAELHLGFVEEAT
ncbi:MAG: DUF1569 domain-containing protein [Planctomycetes bacterium]|nr:DUF1569 domain-containing protein [Planctomycetota bacterium]